MDSSSTLSGWGIADHGVGMPLKAPAKKAKLVRDKIPQIIKSKGREYTSHKASASEYSAKLNEKLGEEAQEYLKSKDVEELADILEVVYALGILHKVSPKRLESLRKRKAKERGAFTKRIILDSW